MSNGGAQTASGIAMYRTLRELGSRSPRSYAAVREPNELVVIHRFTGSTDPRAKSTASFVSADGGVALAGDAMAALIREARCLAKNWHPNIARVRHVDILREDLTVATELVDGATLADLLTAAAQRAAGGGSAGAAKVAPGDPVLPLPVLVRILVDVVTGLSGLHGLRDDKGAPLGAIHGALSPANILVGKDGVARLLNALRPRPLRLAAGTEAVGYAAPEALDLGATQDVRADLHSVGVIMWEGLTGRRLYEETDPARVLARQREEDVAAPSFPPGSPFARLADVTMRALAFDPALRFKTAAEMAAALRNIAATRIATGTVVATQVADLAGERIRARRIELDPSATGKRRLTSDRNLRAANVAAPPPAPSGSASASARTQEHDTLPPGALDPTDPGPPSSIPHDLSVRDFLDAAVSPPSSSSAAAAPPAPPAPPSAPALPKKPAARPAPPLIRKSPNAMSSASMKVDSSVAAPSAVSARAAAVPSQTTDRGLGPPAPAPAPAAASPVVRDDAPAFEHRTEPAAAVRVEAHVESPDQASPLVAAPSVIADPAHVAAYHDVAPAPPLPGAYMQVVHTTPEAAFTPASIAPARDRRPAIAILLGCLLVLLLVVGFFASRSTSASPPATAAAGTMATSSVGASVGSAADTTAPPHAEPTGAANAGAATRSDEVKPETPPAPAAAETATSEARNEATPTPIAEAAPTATAAATEAATSATTAPPPAAGATAGPRQQQTPTAPRPKRPTYEPLGI